MVTCRPDLSFATIKLSQYTQSPAECHYIALKNVFRYLMITKSEGLTYWRTSPNSFLPTLPLPTPVTPMNQWALHLQQKQQQPISPLHGYTDSDWASDVKH